MSAAPEAGLVLAIHPFTRGLAFTLFENPLSPVDWGMKHLRGDQEKARSLEASRALIGRLQPDALVIEDFGVRRSERVRRLGSLIAVHAQGEVIGVHRYSRSQVRECFAVMGARTRYEIAQAIALRVAALSIRLPRARKLWESEDPRMSLFDAASLVLTFYHSRGWRSGETGLV